MSPGDPPSEEDLLAMTRAQIISSRDPAALQVFLEGRTEDEVSSIVATFGADTFLEPTFAGIAERFLPDAAPGRSAVAQLDIVTARGIEAWHVEIGGGRCQTGRGARPDATFTVTIPIAVFLRMAAGIVEGPQAFLDGSAKVKGDLMLAQRMLDWFDVPVYESRG